MSELPGDKWWRSFYNDMMADMFLVYSDARELSATCQFLTENLRISPGSLIFDQCCGIGSLSLPLARTGAEVIGIDQCQSYIERANRNASAEKAAAHYSCDDAFIFVPDRPCDSAFNWGSSFGYADDDDRNQRMLECAIGSLKAGGRFILDYQNIPGVLRNFKQCIVRRHTTADGDVILLRECQVNLPAGRLEQCWTYILPDGRRITERSRLQLYLPHTIAAMLQSCGFTDIRFFGNVRGESLSFDSPRCICLGTKP